MNQPRGPSAMAAALKAKNATTPRTGGPFTAGPVQRQLPAVTPIPQGMSAPQMSKPLVVGQSPVSRIPMGQSAPRGPAAMAAAMRGAAGSMGGLDTKNPVNGLQSMGAAGSMEGMGAGGSAPIESMEAADTMRSMAGANGLSSLQAADDMQRMGGAGGSMSGMPPSFTGNNMTQALFGAKPGGMGGGAGAGIDGIPRQIPFPGDSHMGGGATPMPLPNVDIAQRGGFDPWAASREMSQRSQNFGASGMQTMEQALPQESSIGRQRLAQLISRSGSR